VNAAQAVIDLDDADALLGADRDGLLRAASMAGAHVRAVTASLDEGALDSLRDPDARPRTVIWVAGRGGAAETAGTMLAATAGGSAPAPIVIAAEAPPWIGPLDVLIVAGEDPGDPALVGAAASGVRRGARVVIAAPYEGALRDITAGRVAVLDPRLPVVGDLGLCRYLAVGLAVLESVDPRLRVDLAALADELDAEALRNSAGREVFTNPAKSLVERMSRRRVVFVGDCAATLALARHGSGVLLRAANEVAAATGLADALTALRMGSGPNFIDPAGALFHDEEIDGPITDRLRVVVLTLDAERAVVASRVAGFDDVDVVGAEDVPDLPDGQAARPEAQRAEQQLAILAVRLEMAAVYLRLVRG
jgi:hypothetical protein